MTSLVGEDDGDWEELQILEDEGPDVIIELD
jgi:hypothetical protein